MNAFVDKPEILPSFVRGNRSRTTAAGIDHNEYDRVTAGLTTLREWPEACCAAARGHLDLAERARAAGHRVSAGEAYRDAAIWFHFATILPHPDRELLATAAHEADDAMGRALAQLDPSAERIERPDFVGWLRRPAGAGQPPVVVVVPGMDSSKVEFHGVTEALLRRGLATLAIDGPAQGALLGTTTIRADYHKVVRDAVDVLSERSDLDAARIGAIALSLGDYYGAISAAAEPRLRAVVTVSGPDGLTWDELPPFVTESLILRAGGADAAREFARRVDAAGIAERIQQPLLVVDGGQDVIPGARNGARLADRAPRGEYLLIPEGDHLVGNARWKWLPQTSDWLINHLTKENN